MVRIPERSLPGLIRLAPDNANVDIIQHRDILHRNTTANEHDGTLLRILRRCRQNRSGRLRTAIGMANGAEPVTIHKR